MKVLNKSRLIQAKQKAQLLQIKAEKAKTLLAPKQAIDQAHFNELIAIAKGRRYTGPSRKIKVTYLTSAQIQAREKLEKVTKRSKAKVRNKTVVKANLLQSKDRLEKQMKALQSKKIKVIRKIKALEKMMEV